jgi:Cd2+/Zn2+-exporting ATPase
MNILSSDTWENLSLITSINGGEEMAEQISEEERVKYRIEGEFCANCSAKMERMLSATEGIGETIINYAAKTVFLPPSRVLQAQEIMEKIEAGVKLVPVQRKEEAAILDKAGAAEENKQRLLRIISAGVLFAVGLIFESSWKNSSWGILEYLVYLTAYFIVGYKVLAKQVAIYSEGSSLTRIF